MLLDLNIGKRYQEMQQANEEQNTAKQNKLKDEKTLIQDTIRNANPIVLEQFESINEKKIYPTLEAKRLEMYKYIVGKETEEKKKQSRLNRELQEAYVQDAIS